MIEGVEIKKLITHKDKRGFFRELIRKSDKFFRSRFGQLSHAMVHKGIIKAWHLHKKQTDWLYVVLGDIKLVLYDWRKKSKTHRQLAEILMGEKYGKKIVKIPPGVAHGYKVIDGPTHIIYFMDREYDPNDELRIPPDNPIIKYDWKNTQNTK
jgi:dTDP-4-dehydrorhamnose 3,5-epimerase